MFLYITIPPIVDTQIPAPTFTPNATLNIPRGDSPTSINDPSVTFVMLIDIRL